MSSDFVGFLVAMELQFGWQGKTFRLVVAVVGFDLGIELARLTTVGNCHMYIYIIYIYNYIYRVWVVPRPVAVRNEGL